MKRKAFRRGSVWAGVVDSVISLIIIVLGAALIIYSFSDNGSLLWIAGIIVFLFGVIFLFTGIVMIVNGAKSMKVISEGKEAYGRISDFKVRNSSYLSNGAVVFSSRCTIYFDYVGESGKTFTSSENITFRLYKRLRGLQMIPIRVLGDRAVFDKKKFESTGR